MSDDTIGMVLDDARERMTKVVVHTRAEFGNIRTGRAAPALVEKLPVEYYGSTVPEKPARWVTDRAGVLSPGAAAAIDAKLEAFEKEGELSEDDLARAEKELDKITQASEADIDSALAVKEQELLED